MRRIVPLLLIACLSAASCGRPADDGTSVGALPDSEPVVADLTAETTLPATTETTASPIATSTTDTTTTTTLPDPVTRAVEQAWTPFGRVGDIVLHHPSDQVETIGFHQSNHEGAQPIEVLEGAVRPIQLPDRRRASDQMSSADIAVAPSRPIRSTVTGTVLRATSYVLYCDNRDEFAVIEPDGHPGIEVKMLHVEGLQVSPGDRVEAGLTVVADQGRVLPFVSDVDEFTPEPSWPHVHIEVVDTAIPNVSSGNSGSEDC